VARETPDEIKTLHEINDKTEENIQRLGVLSDRLRELHDEFGQIADDTQQSLAALEASPNEADKAALQLRARDLDERRKQLIEEIFHVQRDHEVLAAKTQALRTRAHEELEKVRIAGIETQKMLFETAKHLTTLNTAAILVYLAAGEEISLPIWVALLFVLSLAGATASMIETGFKWISPYPTKIGRFGMAVAVSCFFVGLLYSVLHAVLPP
jgi:hypothetical protein